MGLYPYLLFFFLYIIVSFWPICFAINLKFAKLLKLPNLASFQNLAFSLIVFSKSCFFICFCWEQVIDTFKSLWIQIRFLSLFLTFLIQPPNRPFLIILIHVAFGNHQNWSFSLILKILCFYKIRYHSKRIFG